MTHISRLKSWQRPEPKRFAVLDEERWLSRRALLRGMGFGGMGAGLLSCLPVRTDDDDPTAPSAASADGYPSSERWVPDWSPAGGRSAYPAERNPDFAPGRPLTPEDVAATHNNFYEFLPGRAGAVHRYVGDFRPRPWSLSIGGLVEEERDVELDELARIAPLEERWYRFRCVEAWSMTVPWTGLPLAKLIEWCRPTSEARFVRFVSFNDPEVAPGIRRWTHYPWPYYEALRLDEATHPLALLATGIYGHGLPAQHGAPLRVVVPWKYGYKSPKSIVRIEFTAEQPPTFWSDLNGDEYPFLSNVEPDVPHPRWSQATERDLATGTRLPTQPFNGYAEQVARLYV